jgi:hypothetical protein
MSRYEPNARRPRRDALDRLLDTAATPRPPADLAARIARDVPRLAQVAPLAADPAYAARQQANPAPRVMQGTARGWLLAAGMGAMAAGVASIIIGTPPIAPPAIVPQAAAPLAAAESASPVVPAPAAREAVRMPDAPMVAPPPAAAARVRFARMPARAGEQSQMPLTAPLAPGTAPPDALTALAGPPSSTVELAQPPTALPRGQMGPVLPQGNAYSGGATGGIPTGAPVKMSGGPSGN